MIKSSPLSDNINSGLNFIPVTVSTPNVNRWGKPPSKGMFFHDRNVPTELLISPSRIEITLAKGTTMAVRQTDRNSINRMNGMISICFCFSLYY
jgi:hypothetical protein